MDKTRESFLVAKLAACRPLPIALAHELARVKLSNTERMELLNRVFGQLKPIDQFKCRAELLEAKAAKRGDRPAEVMRVPM